MKTDWTKLLTRLALLSGEYALIPSYSMQLATLRLPVRALIKDQNFLSLSCFDGILRSTTWKNNIF